LLGYVLLECAYNELYNGRVYDLFLWDSPRGNARAAKRLYTE